MGWFSRKKQGSLKDPVCGMDVDAKTSAGSHSYNNTTYFFCSDSCLQQFKATPERFVK